MKIKYKSSKLQETQQVTQQIASSQQLARKLGRRRLNYNLPQSAKSEQLHFAV